MCYCMMMTLLLMTAAAGLTLAGTGSACTMPSMMRLQTSDARRTPSFSAASAVDCHQPYIARKQRRNRTTFTLIQVDVLLRSVMMISLIAALCLQFYQLSCLVVLSLQIRMTSLYGHPGVCMQGHYILLRFFSFVECRLRRSLVTAWNLTKLCHELAERASFKNRRLKFGVHFFDKHGTQNCLFSSVLRRYTSANIFGIRHAIDKRKIICDHERFTTSRQNLLSFGPQTEKI